MLDGNRRAPAGEWLGATSVRANVRLASLAAVTQEAPALVLLLALGGPLLFPEMAGGRLAPLAAVIACGFAAWRCYTRAIDPRWSARPPDTGIGASCGRVKRPSSNSGQGLRHWFGVLPLLTLPLIVLIWAALLSLQASVDPAISFRRIYSLVFSVAFYLVTATAGVAGRSGKQERPSVSGTDLWCAAFVVAFVVLDLGVFAGVDWRTYKLPVVSSVVAHFPRLVGPVSSSTRDSADINPNEAGGLLVLGWPVAMAASIWAWNVRRRRLAAALLICASVSVGLLFLTLSRSALLGAAVALVVLLLAVPHARSRWAIAGGLLLLVAATATGIVIATTHATPDRSGGTLFFAGIEWTTRLDLWHHALQMIRDHPIVGPGVNTFPLLLQQQYPVSPGSDPYAPHAHNLLLQTGVDFGLVGVADLAWISTLIWRQVRVVLREPSSSGKAFAIGATAGLAGHIAFGLTDTVAIGAKPGFIVWWTCALLEYARHNSRGDLP